MTFLDRLNSLKFDFTQNRSGGKNIKFQQSPALTSHFESFWSIVVMIFDFCKSIIGYIHHFYHFQVQHQVMIVHQRKISWNQQKRNYKKFVKAD